MSKLDNDEQTVGRVLNLAGKRIAADCNPDNPGAYETGIRARLRAEHGDEFLEMARSGMTAEQIVEAHLAQPQSTLDALLRPREPRPEGPEPRPKAHYEIADAERRANAEMIRDQDAGREFNLAAVRALRAQLRADNGAPDLQPSEPS